MNLAAESTASRLRKLKSRGLAADAYLEALVQLADSDGDSGNNFLDRAERVFALRHRVAALRKRVKELEAHK